MKEKRNAFIEAARETAKLHLATDTAIFNGSYPCPTHGYEIFSFTNPENGQSAKIAIPEMVLSLHY